MSSFVGKTLVITGSGRRAGLGEGIAQKFASMGANVVIGDIGKTQGEQFPEHGVATASEMELLAQDLEKLGPGKMRSFTCDVRVESQVEALIAYAVKECGSVDILINNAGIGYLMSPIVDTKEENWDAVLDVNLKGTFLVTKHAARQMIAQGRGGRIINIASQAAKSGFPHAAAYVSSKHALIGFTRTASIEMGA
ncbi:MAG: SDR family NAD(P)-dependent oxidoreductase, partial [Actinomycetes bacterium]